VIIDENPLPAFHHLRQYDIGKMAELTAPEWRDSIDTVLTAIRAGEAYSDPLLAASLGNLKTELAREADAIVQFAVDAALLGGRFDTDIFVAATSGRLP